MAPGVKYVFKAEKRLRLLLIEKVFEECFRQIEVAPS